MEAIRRTVEADALRTVVPLPESMHQMRLQIIILPAPEENKKEVSSALRALRGALSDEGMTLDDYRRERLERYATAH